MTLDNKIHHANEIANAIQRHESEYATWELRGAINLPTPQVCGTSIQQRTYAMDKAMTLIEEYSQAN